MNGTTDSEEIARLLTADPFARELIEGREPARLAYIGLDDAPRAIPMGFHFDGAKFVMATAERSAKVAALRAHPAVALTIDTMVPLRALLVRGTASVTVVDGVPDEYLQASSRVMPPETHEGFEVQVRAMYDRMARIDITPTWVTVLDFETRAPQAVADIAAEKGFGTD